MLELRAMETMDAVELQRMIARCTEVKAKAKELLSHLLMKDEDRTLMCLMRGIGAAHDEVKPDPQLCRVVRGPSGCPICATLRISSYLTGLTFIADADGGETHGRICSRGHVTNSRLQYDLPVEDWSI